MITYTDILSENRALPKTNKINILIHMRAEIDIDILIGKNLRRLRTEKNISQESLAQQIGTTASRLSAYESGREGMGKDIMTRVCKALKVKPYEFYIEASTPIAENEKELQHLLLYREAEALQIAEELDRYTAYTIDYAKAHRGSASAQHPTIQTRARQSGEQKKKRKQKSA